jgi:hypothetical protein
MRGGGSDLVPGYEQLRAMPGLLRSVLAGVGEAEARWRPAAGRWCVVDVLGHLAHVEAHGFRGRLLQMLLEENPRVANYDPDAFAAAGAYDHPASTGALDAFARERELSLVLLRSLRPEAAARPGVHAELGPITIGALLAEWPFHDLGHLRQIAELVRAVKFYPGMGAWQKFYSVRP